MNNSFESYILETLNKLKDNTLKDAIIYSIQGGKRFRSQLIFAILKGFNIPPQKAYPYALSLEMLHLSSLILDDLPCMDDDDLRRGKPTLHKKYSESTAILVAGSLNFLAFNLITQTSDSDQEKLYIIDTFARYNGIEGIMYGQLLDLDPQNKNKYDLDLLYKIQDYKTGSLFKATLLTAMVLVGDQKNIDFYLSLASNIGYIFQMQDDLFDYTKTSAQLGKDALSDIKNDKLTTLKFYDVEKLKLVLKDKFNEIYHSLQNCNFNTEYLKEILIKMETR